MDNLDLRPLSLGEILDRTFTLYRRHFLLFAGIATIPHLLVLAFQLSQAFLMSAPARVPRPVSEQWQSAGSSSGLVAAGLLLGLLGVVVYMVALLFSNGGTVFAVSNLYLGRPITIGEALRRMRGELGTLFGVTMLQGLVVGAATILLILPGIFMACRLAVCIPAALLENLGPRSALERSYALTKGFAGRAFLVYVLYFVLIFAAASLLQWPLAAAMVASRNDPSMVRIWTGLMQVGNFAAEVLVTPVFTIATALLYYDLRVRKEAFDLQMMMNPQGGAAPASGGVPSMLS